MGSELNSECKMKKRKKINNNNNNNNNNDENFLHIPS